MNLYLHPDVANESSEEIEAFRWRIEEALQGGGAWVKALRGPWGPTLRVRVGRRRALFSWKIEGDAASAWVHEIGWRREIYDRNIGLSRARAWVEADRASDLSDLGYELREEPTTEREQPRESESINVLPALSEEQAAFVREVIPIEDDGRDRNAFVFMAKGPPGSGKTVVAADVARDAFLDSPNAQLGQPGADVVVLVPSGKLLRHYRDDLRKTALYEPTSLAHAAPEQGARLWIERFSEFFAAFSTPETGRQELGAWWSECLRQPALRRWSAAHPCVTQVRFVDLLDACFGLDESPGGGAKDALSRFDRPLYDALAALVPGERAAILRAKSANRIRFRWEPAVEALPKLKDVNPGRPLVFVVDEAQDLVPAQWKTLIEACFLRHRERIGQTVIALLGDENQRVAPTAFAWSDVSAFVRELHPDLGGGRGCVPSELTGSFRIRREIAKVANTLMEGALVGDRARRASVADPSGLHAGGSVVVVRTADPEAAIERAMEILAPDLTPDDRLVHIGPPSAGGSRLDVMDPREAKGLEYPTLVATSLLRDELNWDTRSRAYVALTRAKDRVALVLTQSEWNRVASVWEGLVEQEDAEQLATVLEGLVLRALDQDQAAEQRARIDNLVEAADEEDAEFPPEVFERAARLVEAGTAGVLVAHLDDVLRRRPAWDAAVRAFGSNPLAQPTQRIAAWLLLGDIGAALLVARRAHAPRAVILFLQRLASEDGPLSAASIELRSASGVGDDAHLVTLMVDAFWDEAARAFSDPDYTQVRRYVVGRERLSDVLARAVMNAVDAAQSGAIASIDELTERLAARRQTIQKGFRRPLSQRRSQELLDKHLATLDKLAKRAQEEGR